MSTNDYQDPEITSQHEIQEQREAAETAEAVRINQLTLDMLRDAAAQSEQHTHWSRAFRIETREVRKMAVIYDQLLNIEHDEGVRLFDELVQTHSQITDWDKKVAEYETKLSDIQVHNNAAKLRNARILGLLEEEKQLTSELEKRRTSQKDHNKI